MTASPILATPTVVDVRDVATAGQPWPADVIYIGRRMGWPWNLPASRWANPYTVRKWGRTWALTWYRHMIDQELRMGRLTLNQLRALGGQRLACWCGGDRNTCHGGVLVDVGAVLGLWPREAPTP